MPVRCPSPSSDPVCGGEIAVCASVPLVSPPGESTATAYDLNAVAPDFEYVHADLVLAAAAGEWHRTIALANAAIAAGDPRKLTWAAIDALRARVGHETVAVDAAALRHLLGVLVSVLPPRAANSPPGGSAAR